MNRRFFLFLAVVVLTVASCGGGQAPEAGSDTTDAPRTSAERGGEESLADFFGYGSDDPEAAEAQYREEETRRQELIRACMAEQGFDYIPAMPPEESFQAWGPEDEEERVRTQGFGITTWYGNEEQFESGVEWVDPNQSRVEAMSESERQAYYDALYGSEDEQMEGAVTEVDPETGEEMTYVEGFGAGCEGEASAQIWGDQSQMDDLWMELQPQMEAMYERIQADPRIVEFNEEWSACMAESGYELESRDAMYEMIFEDFQQRLDQIIGPNGGFSDPFAGWSEEEISGFFEEKTQEEINAFFEEAQRESMANIDQEALAALQQEEIDMAVADFECGSDFMDLYQEVSAEYESEFINANRETLEKIRDAQGG